MMNTAENADNIEQTRYNLIVNARNFHYENFNKWIIPLLLSSLLFSCIGYRQIGSVTVISTRNYNPAESYSLKKRDADVKISRKKAKKKDIDMMNYAIDELLKENKGEYIKNARIYISKDFKKMKIEGDVWGY